MEKRLRSYWPEWCAWFVYASLVAAAIPYHEPFADEAQAWQLARSLSLASLFKTYIHYEGTPGLWYFLMWAMQRLHIGYAGLHWICGAIATTAVWLLLFKSPLPRYLKLTLPFTYFLLFQYAVVARSYALAPLFLFLIALWWKQNPIRVALALGFLANVSLHTAVLSGGLATVYLIEQIRKRNGAAQRNWRKLLLCALLLLAFYAFAIWTAWPPHDLGMQRWVRGEHRPISATISAAIVSLTWAVCQPPIVSILFWGVIALWFTARRKLLYLLPVLYFAIFCGAVRCAWWNAGLLIPYLACALWITWPAPGSRPYEFDKAARVALATLIGTQILWTGYALFYDHYYAFSPDAAAAEFLKPFVTEGAKIAVTYWTDDPTWEIRAYPSVGIQPYFDHNIYANTPYPFWWWSDQDSSEDRFEAILPSHPQIVLVETVYLRSVQKLDLDHPKYAALMRDGYRYRSAYCGAQPQGWGLGATICHVFLEYYGGNGAAEAQELSERR